MTEVPSGEARGNRSGAELEHCRVLVIVPTATREQATVLMLWWLRWLVRTTDLRFEVLVLAPGPLLPEFEALGPTHLAHDPDTGSVRSAPSRLRLPTVGRTRRHRDPRELATTLGPVDVAVLASAAAGAGLELLSTRPPVVISWIHHIGTSLDRTIPPAARRTALGADWFITCADVVSDTLVGGCRVDRSRVVRHHGFIEPFEAHRSAGGQLRHRLGIPADALVIGGTGVRHWRTGPDLFLEVLDRLRRNHPHLDVHGIWAGGPDPYDHDAIDEADIAALDLGGRVHLVADLESSEAMGAFDVFCLTSREDPFPLPILEAGWCGLPIVSFAHHGVCDLVPRTDTEPLLTVVDALDVDGFAAQVASLLADPDRRATEGARLHHWIGDRHLTHHRAPDLLHDLGAMVRATLHGDLEPDVHWHGRRMDQPARSPRPGPPATGGPETHVVTVDATGQVVGTVERLTAHRAGGIRHLAISVVVLDPEGRVLLQQRAHTKPLFAGRWSNTVCTHPLPGEPPAAAAARRLVEELDVACELDAVGQFSYAAFDPSSGLSENELDHVFVGRTTAVPSPDPDEVAAVRWVDPADLAHEMAATPDHFTPWLRPVLAVAGLVP